MQVVVWPEHIREDNGNVYSLKIRVGVYDYFYANSWLLDDKITLSPSYIIWYDLDLRVVYEDIYS